MGMTIIEKEIAESTLRKNRALISSLTEINWEQRRYEIAKEMLPKAAESVTNANKSGGSPEMNWLAGKTIKEASALVAINYADALIEELRKGKSDEG